MKDILRKLHCHWPACTFECWTWHKLRIHVGTHYASDLEE